MNKFLTCLIAFGLVAAWAPVKAYGATTTPTTKSTTKKTAKVDVNKATEAELEALPGIGAAYAKKIIDGRPYKSAADLVKVGIPQATIDKIKPSLTFSKVKEPRAQAAKKAKAAKKEATPPKEQPHTGKIDINNATEQELEALPGVGAAYAKKIIDGRPYKTSSDLLKVGIPQSTIDKIKYSVHYGTVRSEKATKATKAREGKEAKETKSVSTPSSRSPEDIIAKVPPRKGMVWVNTDSKVYHKEGDRWYGKTQEGEFMTEEAAIKYGARLSKQDQ